MKYFALAAAFAALAPSLVYAQNQQFSDCRTLENAGNFVGSDEVLVNGLVCKVGKPITNSATPTQGAAKAAERSGAMLGIVGNHCAPKSPSYGYSRFEHCEPGTSTGGNLRSRA